MRGCPSWPRLVAQWRVYAERTRQARHAEGPSWECSTEIPVYVLGAKYKWARGIGLL